MNLPDRCCLMVARFSATADLFSIPAATSNGSPLPAISDEVSLTASKDILCDIALGTGPKDSLITLGYAGWDAGQLEEELSGNSWLTIPAEADIIFNTNCARARLSGSTEYRTGFEHALPRGRPCLMPASQRACWALTTD